MGLIRRHGGRRIAGAGRLKRKKSSSPLDQGWYCLQMIPAPTQQHNKSMFVREQSAFMAEVQPTVPLHCEDLTCSEVMPLLHGHSLPVC